MTKKSNLPFLPILLGSFFISFLQSENLAWPILAFIFHILMVIFRCLIARYLTHNSRVFLRPKWMKGYLKITKLLPLSVLIGFMMNLHFFWQKESISFIEFVINSNLGFSTIGIVLGFVVGTLLSYQLEMASIKEILFFFTLEEVNYDIHEYITEDQEELANS